MVIVYCDKHFSVTAYVIMSWKHLGFPVLQTVLRWLTVALLCLHTLSGSMKYQFTVLLPAIDQGQSQRQWYCGRGRMFS